jgi:HSP20 family protein
MAIVTYRPMTSSEALNAMLDVTENLFGGYRDLRTVPIPVNVIEDAEGFTVQAVVPGVSPEAIDVSLENQVLTIKGELKQAELDENARYRMREQITGSFFRALRFSQPVDATNVSAQYDHGVLTLRLPKAAEAKPRKISVTGSTVSNGTHQLVEQN